ncbi:MAG: TatD family hydrolase [Candidatus Kapabacteria bacterium]|nr:TatD family hydrolase [Candidatus Kapabacteria bacterium]
MIDTHAHIDTTTFDNDRDEMLQRAFSAGIENIIIPSIEPETFDKVYISAGLSDKIFCGIGIHPHYAKTVNTDSLTEIENRSFHPKTIAIGEIGLDYYYDFAPKNIQINAFRDQLEIAKSRKLPVIVHNRESDRDLMENLKSAQNGDLQGVLHCFSGDKNTLKQAMDLGFYISFTGNITFKKSTLSDIVEICPVDRFMLETDCPWMAPIPNRGKRNEPSLLYLIAEKVSEIKKITTHEVIEMTNNNARKLFGLLIVMFIIFLNSNKSISQTTDSTQSDTVSKVLQIENPYEKKVGISFLLGLNTNIATQKYGKNQQSKINITYEGLVSYGGAISFFPFDFLELEATYFYTKNQKIADENPPFVKPFKYHTVEFGSHWLVNPFSRISIFGTIGASYMRSIELTEHSNYAVNTGLGININIPFAYGQFVPVLEWRLDFFVNEYVGSAILVKGKPPEPDVHTSNFFSFPRFGLFYYPKF